MLPGFESSKRVASHAFCSALLIVCLAGSERLLAAAKGEPPQRTVQGLVTDAQENPITKAVVQLKNLKTMDVKSFYTDEKGAYHFNGLDPDTNYELKAIFGSVTSGVRKVTPFDSRKEIIINFKVDNK